MELIRGDGGGSVSGERVMIVEIGSDVGGGIVILRHLCFINHLN